MSNSETILRDIKVLYSKMENIMDKKRFIHTVGVANTAACMAMRYGIDPYKAYIAGLLHDNAKCIDEEKKRSICQKYKLTVSYAETENHDLLHAKVGAILAKEKYGIYDEEIISAIRFHTTGRPNMSTLEKIVYIADYIEMNRKKQNNLNEVRRLAFSDLNLCMREILEGIIHYLEKEQFVIDAVTLEAYEYYKSILS